MTPYLTSHASKSLSNKNNSSAWIIAALSRAKKLPKYAEMMSTEKPDKKQMENDLKQALKNYGGKK